MSNVIEYNEAVQQFIQTVDKSWLTRLRYGPVVLAACKIQERYSTLLAEYIQLEKKYSTLKQEVQKMLKPLEDTGEAQDWSDGPETGRQYVWHEVDTLHKLVKEKI